MSSLSELWFDAECSSPAGGLDAASEGADAVEQFMEGSFPGAWPQDTPMGDHVRDNRDRWLAIALGNTTFANQLGQSHGAIKKAIEGKVAGLMRGVALITSMQTVRRTGSLKLADIKSHHPGIDSKQLFLVGSAGPKHKCDDTPDGLERLHLAATVGELAQTAALGVAVLLVTRQGLDSFSLGYALGVGNIETTMDVYVHSDSGHTSLLLAASDSRVPKLVLEGSESQRTSRRIWSDGKATQALTLANPEFGDGVNVAGTYMSLAEAKIRYNSQLAAAKDLAKQWESMTLACTNLRMACSGSANRIRCRLASLAALDVLTGGKTLATRPKNFGDIERLVVGILDMTQVKWAEMDRTGASPHVTALLELYLESKLGPETRYLDTFGDIITKLKEAALVEGATRGGWPDQPEASPEPVGMPQKAVSPGGVREASKAPDAVAPE